MGKRKRKRERDRERERETHPQLGAMGLVPLGGPKVPQRNRGRRMDGDKGEGGGEPTEK